MPLVLKVLIAAQSFSKTGQRFFKPYGLTLAQFNVLNLLADEANGMRASDLARALIVDASNVTGLLKRMKVEGFLREHENGADRRQHIVGLTSKGQRVWRKANREYLRRLKAVESTLSPFDRKVTERVLDDMIAAVSNSK